MNSNSPQREMKKFEVDIDTVVGWGMVLAIILLVLLFTFNVITF